MTFDTSPELSNPFCDRRTPEEPRAGREQACSTRAEHSWAWRRAERSSGGPAGGEAAPRPRRPEAQGGGYKGARARIPLCASARARTVQVDEHTQSDGLAYSQHASQLGQRAVGAARVRLVRLPHPVADGHAQRVDPLRREPLQVLLGDPLPPVLPQLAVALDRAEHLAEAVHVHGRLVGRLVLELVEQARRDPGLHHEPTAQVDAAQLGCEVVRLRVPLLGEQIAIADVLRHRRHWQRQQGPQPAPQPCRYALRRLRREAGRLQLCQSAASPVGASSRHELRCQLLRE